MLFLITGKKYLKPQITVFVHFYLLYFGKYNFDEDNNENPHSVGSSQTKQGNALQPCAISIGVIG